MAVFLGSVKGRSKKNLDVVRIPISKNPTNLVYLKSVDFYFNNISGNLYKRLKGNIVDFNNPIKIDKFSDSFFEKLSDNDFGTVKNYIDKRK